VFIAVSDESSLKNDKATSWEGEGDKVPEKVVNQEADKNIKTTED
jgi:hypothetical protein